MAALRVVPAEGAFLGPILDATYDIWNDGLSREAYARWWEAQLKTPWGRRNLRRFALVDGDRVLASAKRYWLSGIVDNVAHPIAGIGAVFTQPDARRHGHARALIEMMLEQASAEGATLALLFSEIDPDYYARLGFEIVSRNQSELAIARPRARGAPAIGVRAGADRDLRAIEAMGRERARSYRFHLDRDVDLIQYAIARTRLMAGLGPPGASELEFFVAEEGASAVAYVVIAARGREWSVQEAGDRDPSAARVGAILQTLAARDPSHLPRLRGRLPAGFLPPQLSVTETEPATDVMMIRSLAGAPLPRLKAEDVFYWQSDVF